jgi:hypothetical protein
MSETARPRKFREQGERDPIMTATAITSLGEDTEVTERPSDGRSLSNTNVGS